MKDFDLNISKEPLEESPFRKLNEILEQGIVMGGSDVHLLVGSPPRVRVHGDLKDMRMAVLTDYENNEIISPLLDTQQMTLLEGQGQIDCSYEIPYKGRFRVNIYKQHGAISGIFRILYDDIPEFNKLGLPEHLRDTLDLRRGMVLVTGQTGSGKSTTLACMLNDINNTMHKHIITLEDPIEYQQWSAKCNFSQREIGRDVKDFATGLRAALREDPDIILVGEMRDLETTDIAITSAETGHLLFSTLHTNGAVETITRILDMYPTERHNQVRHSLAELLEVVISQQLLPKVGGGRIVAVEVMKKDKHIKELIYENRLSEIREYLDKADPRENMISMDRYIRNLFEQGLILKETAISYAIDKREMEEKLRYL